MRLAIIVAVFFAEKILLNWFVDFQRADAAQGLGAFLRASQHWGFRFLVALAAAVSLFAYVRGGPRLLSAKAAIRSSSIHVGWLLVHLLAIACLVPVTSQLFPDAAPMLSFESAVALWLLLAMGAFISALLTMAPWKLWTSAARALGAIWPYAIVAALLGASAMQLSQRLWEPTAGITFELVRLVLLPIMPGLHADSATRVLATDHFAVQVSEVCSGLEGMGLILAFTVAWLLYFRREYIFPRALLLVPLGLILIFGLNVFRIAALVFIGDIGHPDVAEYGFHSQAGWIAFNTVACALVYFSRRHAWMNRAAAAGDRSSATDNPTATYLLPLLAILAAGILSRAMSGYFENFYGLRLLVGAAVIALYRRQLAAIDWRWSWRGPLTGLVVFALWMTASHFSAPQASMPASLSAFSPAGREIWIAVRLATSVFVVPLAEELAYRGYLMRRLMSPDFEAVRYPSVRWSAMAATAVLFGLAHGSMWLPGIVAGLAFGFLVVRRGTLGEAVAAHATANALVGVAVLAGHQWQLW